eukprot:2438233-Rhodomonas_salina.1
MGTLGAAGSVKLLLRSAVKAHVVTGPAVTRASAGTCPATPVSLEVVDGRIPGSWLAPWARRPAPQQQ